MKYSTNTYKKGLNKPGSLAKAVEVERIVKTFKKRKENSSFFRPIYSEIRALDDISFAVKRGEIFGILGSNGSGKSTLIRALSTLLIPDSGLVKIFGMELLEHEAEIRKLLNRVSVDAAFFKKLSPRENLLYAARLYGLDPKKAEERALQILNRLGITNSRFYEPLEEMSRGMQQKVAIARAFLASPVIVLLDEPTTGLDPKSRKDVQDFILELRSAHDATIILTTHDMPEAERLCDRIAFIHLGRFVARGTSSELKALVGPLATLDDAFIALSGGSITQ